MNFLQKKVDKQLSEESFYRMSWQFQFLSNSIAVYFIKYNWQEHVPGLVVS